MSHQQSKAGLILCVVALLLANHALAFKHQNFTTKIVQQATRHKRQSNNGLDPFVLYEKVVGASSLAKGQFTNNLTQEFIQFVGSLIGGN